MGNGYFAEKLKAEVLYVPPEEKERIDKMLDEISEQQHEIQDILTSEEMEALLSIFAEVYLDKNGNDEVKQLCNHCQNIGRNIPIHSCNKVL